MKKKIVSNVYGKYVLCHSFHQCVIDFLRFFFKTMHCNDMHNLFHTVKKETTLANVREIGIYNRI